ncbi:MAG: class I SAM-dependent methyltransferase [Amphiplicatus sp.]
MTESENYLKAVRAQYEELPYPRRNPEDEKKRLISTWGDRLDYLNHFGFEGRMKPAGFRVLDAGGGSGDASVFLAEQLRDRDGHVVHLDLSEASIAVARERARLRGLDNIEFVHASLLDLPALGLGRFDYVVSTGVLHHLADPKAGLDALKDCLEEDGLIKVMVYAPYGRRWVYHMQGLMRLYNAGLEKDDIAGQLAGAKEMMAALDGRAWYKALSNSVSDQKTMGDVGVFDLFLHSQDRAFSIPELYDFIEASGLVFHHFIPTPTRLSPVALADSPVKRRIETLPLRAQQAIMEMIDGEVKLHSCFAARRKKVLPSPCDPELIPSFSQAPTGIEEAVRAQLAKPDLAELKITQKGVGIAAPLTGPFRALLSEIDGRRTIGEIGARAAAATGLGREAAAGEFEKLFALFGEMEWILLRDRALAPFPTKEELQKRVSALYAS